MYYNYWFVDGQNEKCRNIIQGSGECQLLWSCVLTSAVTFPNSAGTLVDLIQMLRVEFTLLVFSHHKVAFYQCLSTGHILWSMEKGSHVHRGILLNFCCHLPGPLVLQRYLLFPFFIYFFKIFIFIFHRGDGWLAYRRFFTFIWLMLAQVNVCQSGQYHTYTVYVIHFTFAEKVWKILIGFKMLRLTPKVTQVSELM